MGKFLNNGEKRIIKKKFWNIPFEVTAFRVDAETPYIILRDKEGKEYNLADVEADELIDRLHRALAILPTSK